MNETANEGNDDVFETSSCCSESHDETAPESSPEGDSAQEDKDMKDNIIKSEEKAVRNARLLVVTAILACAVAVTTAIYIFAKKSDQDTFELEVSYNRHIHCCSILIATINALTIIAIPYLMTLPLVRRLRFGYYPSSPMGGPVQLRTDAAAQCCRHLCGCYDRPGLPQRYASSL
jgi:hypothetical protein